MCVKIYHTEMIYKKIVYIKNLKKKLKYKIIK